MITIDDDAICSCVADGTYQNRRYSSYRLKFPHLEFVLKVPIFGTYADNRQINIKGLLVKTNRH